MGISNPRATEESAGNGRQLFTGFDWSSFWESFVAQLQAHLQESTLQEGSTPTQDSNLAHDVSNTDGGMHAGHEELSDDGGKRRLDDLKICKKGCRKEFANDRIAKRRCIDQCYISNPRATEESAGNGLLIVCAVFMPLLIFIPGTIN